jgi:hypothetical protein
MLCAVDLIGAIAERRFHGREVVSDEDFARRGGKTDLKNFAQRSFLICRGDPNQVAQLRRDAESWARRLLDVHWDAVAGIAAHLVFAGSLLDKQVRAAIARAERHPAARWMREDRPCPLGRIEDHMQDRRRLYRRATMTRPR